jgi:hypothetical protein
MNEYSLSTYPYPSSHYLKLFQDREIECFPNQESVEIQIRSGDLEFEVYLEVVDSIVSPHVLEIAKEVISQVVEMDTQARLISHSSGLSEEEILAYINIPEQREVAFHYYSTVCNTEWATLFTRNVDGTYRVTQMGTRQL